MKNFLFLLFAVCLLIFIIPTPVAQAQCVPGGCPDGVCTALGCIPTDTHQFAAWVLGWAIKIGGGVAFLLMLYGAFQIITSSDDPQGLQEGKEMIVSALAGLLFIIFSLFLLKLIGVEILEIPGFGK